MPLRPTVVAFDLDDTLTDWYRGIEAAAHAVGDPRHRRARPGRDLGHA